jgi:hypothetical protein
MNTTDRRSFESLSAAADRTGISTQTLRRRIACGQLVAYRTGRLHSQPPIWAAGVRVGLDRRTGRPCPARTGLEASVGRPK